MSREQHKQTRTLLTIHETRKHDQQYVRLEERAEELGLRIALVLLVAADDTVLAERLRDNLLLFRRKARRGGRRVGKQEVRGQPEKDREQSLLCFGVS